MGAVECDGEKLRDLEGVEWFHNRILIERVHLARKARKQSRLWTITEMIKPNSNGDLMRQGGELFPNVGLMANLFYARSLSASHSTAPMNSASPR